jgi:dTDP-4-amino-4,6-dideoxygalactose transaminase
MNNPPKRPSVPIFVTQPYLPPLEELIPYLKTIWDKKNLTNNGPFHEQFEAALCEFLGVDHVSLFANGTLALLSSLQSLQIKGEVITTPYSFVATSHALVWNRITPVFSDIDPQTLNLDPAKIEYAISERTTAILPVHCYGHPCDVDAIQAIADKHKLKVIYDAAHAFGVLGVNGSVLREGDLSVLSFHATKVFNTFEGGAVVCRDIDTKRHLDHLKNFGFVDELTVVEVGINGKMSEFNAALGLLQLRHFDEVLSRRKAVDAAYRELLSGVEGIQCLAKSSEVVENYAYFPILIGDTYPLSRDELYARLRDSEIHCRRYFFPLISEHPMYREFPSASPANLSVATDVSRRILCLPMYPNLSIGQVTMIATIIAER